MPVITRKSKRRSLNPDYVRMFFEHQYERIKKHEDQALVISNIVLTISALVLTFGLNNRTSFGSILIIFLPIMILVANVFAILFVRDENEWIEERLMKAKKILDIYAPELSSIEFEPLVYHRENYIERGKFQRMVHTLFIILAIILLILFALDALGIVIV